MWFAALLPAVGFASALVLSMAVGGGLPTPTRAALSWSVVAVQAFLLTRAFRKVGTNADPHALLHAAQSQPYRGIARIVLHLDWLASAVLMGVVGARLSFWLAASTAASIVCLLALLAGAHRTATTALGAAGIGTGIASSVDSSVRSGAFPQFPELPNALGWLTPFTFSVIGTGLMLAALLGLAKSNCMVPPLRILGWRAPIVTGVSCAALGIAAGIEPQAPLVGGFRAASVVLLALAATVLLRSSLVRAGSAEALGVALIQRRESSGWKDREFLRSTRSVRLLLGIPVYACAVLALWRSGVPMAIPFAVAVALIETALEEMVTFSAPVILPARLMESLSPLSRSGVAAALVLAGVFACTGMIGVGEPALGDHSGHWALAAAFSWALLLPVSGLASTRAPALLGSFHETTGPRP
ncbi:MAG: hypothetical protein ACOYEV_15415 [Candidatus Nanopelagicales bacterium]